MHTFQMSTDENALVAGLVHLVHPNPISKYELLQCMKQAFDKQDIQIIPDEANNRHKRSTKMFILYSMNIISLLFN